jgi:hypothetical protein
MGYRFRGLLGSAVLSLTTPVFAASVGHNAHLIRINSLGDGRVVLQFDVDNSACTDTNNPKGYYVAVGQNGVTADGLKNILATAMLTYSQGKMLSFYFDNSTAYCFVSQVTLID